MYVDPFSTYFEILLAFERHKQSIKRTPKMQYKLYASVKDDTTKDQPGGAVYITVVMQASSLQDVLAMAPTYIDKNAILTKVECIG